MCFKFVLLFILFASIESFEYNLVLDFKNNDLINIVKNVFIKNFDRLGFNYVKKINFIDTNFTNNNFCDNLFHENEKIHLVLQDDFDQDNHSNLIQKMMKQLKKPMISINKNQINEWKLLSYSQYNLLIRFIPITSVLSTIVRDLIIKENYKKAAVFMDNTFGNQTTNIAENLSFTELETIINCQNLSINQLKEKLLSLKRLKINNFFILAKSITINKLLEAINQNSMFSKFVNIYVISIDFEKVRCFSCKHATIKIVKPIKPNLHDYFDEYFSINLKSQNRIELFFYFDFLRLIISSADSYLKLINETNYENKIPNLQRNECLKFVLNKTYYDSNEDLSFASNNFNSFVDSDDSNNFNLRKQIVEQTKKTFGFYGDFHLSYDDLDYGYQDILVRFYSEHYLNKKISTEVISDWSFDPIEGNIFLNRHLLEEDDEKTENTEETQEKKDEPDKQKEEKNDKKKDDSETNTDAEKEEENAEDNEKNNKVKDSRVTVFIIEHPPFIMKRVIEKPKEVAVATTTTTTTTTQATKEKDGDEAEEETEGEEDGEEEEEEKKIDFEYYGFLIDLFNLIKEELILRKTPFPDYKFEEIEVLKDVEKMFYGGDRKTEFSGMMKRINETETDAFALAPLSITASREFVIEFSEPFFHNYGIAILMKKPRIKPHFFKFITVLESKVWACITGAYLFTSILLTIFEQFSPQKYKQKKEIKLKRKKQINDKEEDLDDLDSLSSNREFTFKESLWFCITSLTPQGGGEAPRSIYGRLVAATWWLFGFIVIASYTANLAAFLTVSRLESKIDDLKKLSKQYKVRYAPVDDTATDFYFIQMAEIEEKFYEIWKDMSLNDSLTENERAKLAVWDYPVSDQYTKIAAQMVEVEKPKGIINALKKVRDSPDHTDGFAVLAGSLTVDYFANLFCDVYRVGEDFSLRPIALGAKKTNSVDLLKLINPIIIKLEEEGVIEDLKAKYWDNNVNKNNCEDYRKLSNGISLFNSGGVFIIIITGVILTLFLLQLENFIIVYMKVYRAKKQKALMKAPSLESKNNDSFFKSIFCCLRSKTL
uniref:Glutamate receptor ionotropic kainate 2 n=1 Tax=Polyphagotarsonemus latus TaxID=1204166 RepID=A0AAN0LH94_9ACAR